MNVFRLPLRTSALLVERTATSLTTASASGKQTQKMLATPRTTIKKGDKYHV
jgi:hypothetical protein